MVDRVFGPDTCTPEVYEVAARPVVKAAMEGINGIILTAIQSHFGAKQTGTAL